MKKTLLLIAIIFTISQGFSQVKLNLLDGNQIKLDSYVFHTHEGYIDYSYTNDKGKLKNSYVDLDDVFSMNINGSDSILYAPIVEEEFSVAEMNNIVEGRQFAYQEYNPWWAYLTGAAVGCGSMFLPFQNGTIKLLVPIFYVSGMAFAKPTKSYILKHHPEVEGNEDLIWGYKNAGKRKIFKNTVIGTVGGIFISGVIWGSFYLYNN